MSSLFATAPSCNTTPEIAAALLDELRAALLRYVVLPTSHSADAITLWIAATHALPAFGYAPRLVINSPEKRCGKSRLLDIIEATCFDPLVTVNASSAAVFRRIGDGHPPTLLIDEADAIFGSKKAAEQNEDLRALINAGHQRNRPALRYVGPQQTPTNFPTFAMVALAGIGAMPDTVVDRAVNVTMRRRASHEQVDSYRHRRDALPLHHLRDRLTAWAADVLDELSDAEPAMPVEDRAADTWEPLVAVADQAGGNWPARARRAAVLMVTEADEADTDASLGVRLLTDVREAFASRAIPVIATKELLDLIKLVEESPWEAFGLDDRGLARRLRAYQVSSRQVRPDGGQQVRGYRLEDFADAFARYLTDPRQGASQAVTASKPQVSPVTDNPAVTDTSVTDSGSVTVPHARDLHKQPSRDGVTPRDAPPRCINCGHAMTLIEPGQLAHPTCEPWPPMRMPSRAELVR